MIRQLRFEGKVYTHTFKGSATQIKAAKKYGRRVKSMSRCIRCGESRPWCLQFHHRDPNKKFMGIHTMASKGFPIELIKKEINKCDCLCANDHQEVHYRQYWINI